MRAHWKAILGVLGVTLPAVFTYLASRADSNEAKIRAEVAYVTLQGSVKELQEASYAQALQLAELKGQLRAERRSRATMSMAPPSPSMERPAPVDDGDGIEDTQVKLKAPPSFNQAVQAYKAKK